MTKIPAEQHFATFVQIVRRLRAECPWDREQTHQSIRHSLIEEAYEVVEAIDERNMEELKLELGDLLLHVALHSVIAEEEKEFTLNDVLKAVNDKLVRRHPHVFGSAKAGSTRDVKANWEKLKLAEGRTSIIDGIPKELPALLRAHRMQEKASKVGFDWTNKEDAWKKVEEEIEELQGAEKTKRQSEVEVEFGDLLFALVNYARFLHINPELALRNSTMKFEKRFKEVEKELKRRGKQPAESTLEEMDEIWNHVKDGPTPQRS
ncbi:MAG TPA: nucleoside triphosphate pyrophosphohydrolase [Bacteroidota bacterium]|nr:nucleoside triphosphate pyrophosphohydrolase [Bacteroidota bacterium]